MVKSWGWGGWVGWVSGGGPCDYCVSPSPKNWVLGFFRLGLDLWSNLRTGDLDLHLGLTIHFPHHNLTFRSVTPSEV